MMVKAKGPLWHQKDKQHGHIPPKLRGVDQDATWSFSKADGWVYGHGTFCITSHQGKRLALFVWMRNSDHEAKLLPGHLKPMQSHLKRVCMDSKADDQHLYQSLKQQGVQLLTVMRNKTDKTPYRCTMRKELAKPSLRKEYQKRSITVEPMQGLIKQLFDLDRCWMRGDETNRWLFAAMGVCVQIAQHQASRHSRAPFDIQDLVLGL